MLIKSKGMLGSTFCLSKVRVNRVLTGEENIQVFIVSYCANMYYKCELYWNFNVYMVYMRWIWDEKSVII